MFLKSKLHLIVKMLGITYIGSIYDFYVFFILFISIIMLELPNIL